MLLPERLRSFLFVGHVFCFLQTDALTCLVLSCLSLCLSVYPFLGVPLVYELDENLKVIPSKEAIAPLQGRYLGDQEAIKGRIAGVANQTKVIFVEGG